MNESYTVWVKDKCVSIGFMSYEDAVYLSDWHREKGVADEDIEIEEGESLESVKARMASMKPKKQSISADLLNTANSYDDKVALIRMIMAEDSTRVAGVLKSLIDK